jgi:predicted ester cyclase
MEPDQVVRKCLDAIESGNFKEAQRYVADDMQFSGIMPQPIDRREFMNVQENLQKAMPDWKFNAHDFHTRGDTVDFKVQITGTNTHSTPAIAPGMPGIPVTGKHVSLPEEPLRMTVKNDKITNIETDPVPGGGVEGLLHQLGIQIPGRSGM